MPDPATAPLGEWGMLWWRVRLYPTRLERRVLWQTTVFPLRNLDAVEADRLAGAITISAGGRTHRLVVGWGNASAAREAVAQALPR